ncbi:zinc finger CCCH domain-containing protein 24 isoform X2 [Magnolia sinica]|uniref:zinc finger CCCH domain-containing protein 24 isoform X2 n=1 Tax=Magnolia sinica TaxID=86752 RepID=UPI002658FE28|nr:zinc finger CCCH domain-containing protein 24 isoform X2 [Magnolia sinica]
MALSDENPLSPTENPTLTEKEIQPSNLQSSDGIVPVDALKGKRDPEAEEGEEDVKKEPATADEEIQPSDPQPTDGGDSIGTNKRKTPGGGEEKKSSLHPLWKTSLCSYFRRQSGVCSHGDACRFAHSEAELRPRADNSWDPTSERAKKLLKSNGSERVEAVPEAREDVLPVSSDGAERSDAALSRCLVHLPLKWTSENLKSFLDTQGIIYKTAKKKKGMAVGFVGFEDEERIKDATEVLDGKSIGNKRVKLANVIHRSYEKKSNLATALDKRVAQPTENPSGSEDPSVTPSMIENEDTVEKDSDAVDGSTTKTRSARDVVTPLAHMPYNDQLEHKKNSLVQTLKRLTRNARKACPDAVPLPEWIHKSREIGGLPCKLEGILESPLVDGYRNKCEFSVGYSLQGKRTVGYMLGNFREGITAVEEPVDCLNVSKICCKYALIFQEFLQSSTLPIWNRIDNTGFWRQLTVREGRSPCEGDQVENVEACIAEVMLIVQVCSSRVDNELVTVEFQRMAQAFAHGASTSSSPLPLTVLVVQDHKGISNAAPSDSPLLPLTIPKAEGVANSEDPNAVETRIHDYISNLRFSISPTAFFQVNTLAAEKLYSLAGDWAGLGPDTLLFDICCGTGTIGLTLAHRVGMVVGIEMNASAVSDAHRNAEINGIKNCRFVCAKAEDVMGSLLREYLSLAQQQDETLHVSESNNSEDTGGKEDGAHVDKIQNQDACASNADSLMNDEGAEKMSDCSADRSNESLEAAQVPKGGVEVVDSTKEDTVDASIPNENLDNEMADVKSMSGSEQSNLEEFKDPSKKNCISEENVNSDVPVRQFKHVVAIVDPPRVGLHPIVIKALRTHPSLRRLVYISCNPETLVANAIELCTPSPDKPEKGKNNRGWRKMSSAGLARHRAKSMPNSEPFQPVKAMAVDLFPHTPHCEMVMLLERILTIRRFPRHNESWGKIGER